VLVREKQGLRFDIFRSYTSAKDTAGAIKALRKYGPEEPQLYPAALAYFTSSPNVLKEAGDELDAVLKKIDEDNLMAPLQVIQTLSTNAVATIGMVKNYLTNTIERERKEISNVRLSDITFFFCHSLANRLIRTASLSNHIERKRPRSVKRLKSLTQNQPCSRHSDVLDAVALSTFQRFTSCANIPFTSVV
jgi:hypothetical protein